ncbi:MAG: acetolactate synthase large subunit, partial [Actinomycetales bacterium]
MHARAVVLDTDDIPRAIAEAFYIANSGRPGPVLVDIAKDALQKMTGFNYPKKLELRGYRPQIEPDKQAIKDAAALIADSSKPVFYIGGG